MRIYIFKTSTGTSLEENFLVFVVSYLERDYNKYLLLL